MDNALIGMSHYLYNKLKGNGTQNVGNLVLENFYSITEVSSQSKVVQN